MSEKMFYLQHQRMGYCGNSPFWWSSEGGYTPLIDKAKKFTEQDADLEIRSSKNSHGFVKWNCDEIDAIAVRVVDMQDMRRLE